MGNRSIAQLVNERASASNIPLSALLEITHQCNLSCYFCYISPKPKSRELSTLHWKKILKELSDLDCLYVTLSGGEPFLRKDVFEIIAEARALHFAVSLITNGTMISEETAKRLAGLGVLDVGVRFHAADAAQHDQLTGIAGSFAAAYRGLCQLQVQGIRTIIKHTVSNRNFGEFRRLAKMADEEGALFECDSMIFPQVAGSPSEFSLGEKEQHEFLEFMQMIPVHFLCSANREANLHCDAGRSLCGISPYGDVFPCIQLPIHLGNLHSQSLKEIWKGQKASQFRNEEKITNQECLNCQTANFCSRCPGLSHAESRNWQGPSVNQCLRARILYQCASEARNMEIEGEIKEEVKT